MLTTVLALLTALIAVISPAITAINYWRDYHSHTSLIVTGVGATTISMHVWNTGNKPSTLISYALVLGDVPLATLEPAKDDKEKTSIPEHGKATIHLIVSSLTREGVAFESPSPNNAPKGETPALVVVIEESNERHRTLEVTLSSEQVRQFIKNS